MAGKVRVLKDVGGGLRGSTSGLRFNPREAPEFAEEDRNLGRDDPKGKQKEEEKKRREKEERHKKIAGLHHISMKIKNKTRAKGDNQRNDERLSEMTGPVSSTGYPSDVASGAKTGGGSAMGGPNIMTGESIGPPSDILKIGDTSKRTRGAAGGRGRYGMTETLRSIRAKDAAERTHRQRGQMGPTTESSIYQAQSGLPINNTKQPWLLSTRMGNIAKRVRGGPQPKIKRGIKTHGRAFQAKGGSYQGDFRDYMTKTGRSQIARREGTGRGAAKATNMFGKIGKKISKKFKMPKPKINTSRPGRGSAPGVPTPANMFPIVPREPYQSGQARSTSGMEISPSGAAPSSGMSGFESKSPTSVATSEDIYQVTTDLLMKAKLSQADLVEFKWLVRELRRLIRSGPLRKAGLEDAEHDEERPTPNAHRKTTSSPTGATSVDPDDDPRFWGAHPMGLLLPRRGHP